MLLAFPLGLALFIGFVGMLVGQPVFVVVAVALTVATVTWLYLPLAVFWLRGFRNWEDILAADSPLQADSPLLVMFRKKSKVREYLARNALRGASVPDEVYRWFGDDAVPAFRAAVQAAFETRIPARDTLIAMHDAGILDYKRVTDKLRAMPLTSAILAVKHDIPDEYALAVG